MAETLLDLVLVIDTSVSMKPEAQALSQAAETAIAHARSLCPSDLRITWLGIEGTWKKTQFTCTVREYLTGACAVPESALKSRKKGELKSGGAQEDAARVMQDIADFFDWRSGSKRAIFYLGNEALDAGGAKTLPKDIEAANQAIQVAKAAQVIIHTHLGQSRSRYRHTLAAEYARVAQETGGQFFTAEDALGDFATVLERVICGSQTISISQGDRQSVNPSTSGDSLSMATRSKASAEPESSTEPATASPAAIQPPAVPSVDQPENTAVVEKYTPATGLEDYGRWKTMFKDRKSNPNDPPFRRGRIWC